MIYETNEYEIIYNECDKEYINEFINYFEKEKVKIFNFFDIKKLKKKLIIKLYDEREKYATYRNNNLYDWSIGNMDVDNTNYYIHMLSYKEIIKIKGHDKKKLEDFNKLLVHEFVHVCHEDYGTCHKVLRWISEGIAIYLSKQNYSEGLTNCNVENLLNNGSNSYQNYFTLVKYCFDNYEIDYLKRLVSEPNFGLEKTNKICNECIKEYGNYKVILKDEYLNNKSKFLNMIKKMFDGEINEVSNIEDLEKHLDFIFTRDNALLILNIINDEIISMVNAYEYKNKNWCLFSLYVNKKYRGNSESIKILKYLIKYLDKYDYEKLISGIEEENKKSIYIHEISGFKNTGCKWNELEEGFPEDHLGFEYRR